ncbi:glutamate receptor 1-like [Hyposmocoma kahamanoa]|uniref:glutamate receptor 1-like n=1 Tax=Hyposmocoma kahamanoa TaxID=1477025 RepID=UPI000E6D9CEC|nr:glutamate receptor 1-like [Hyposmocoma kahamanoa]
MAQHSTPNKSRLDFQVFVDIINTADAFKLSRLICNQFTRGVIAMLGAVTPDSFDILHSYTNTFQMPFVTPWFPEKVLPPTSGLVDYAVSMRPDYHHAVMDVISYYGWKNIIYLYDSHDGLLRLQQLYQSLDPRTATFRIANVKRVGNASDAIEYLNAIERLDRWSKKFVVLDSTTQLAKDTLIMHVRDVHLGRRNYHYLLSGLVMDDRWEKEVAEFGAINVTGFRVVDFSRKFARDFEIWKRTGISAKSALMFDGVQVLVDSITRLLRRKPEAFRASMRRNANANTTKIIDCNPKGKVTPLEHGDKISKMIKKTEIEGLTGIIRFDEAGHRRNFSLQVLEMTLSGDMVKIGTWYDDKGLRPLNPKSRPESVTGWYDRNKTYIVSTIEEPPYIMRLNPEYPASGTIDPYKGFCADLTKILADKLEIKYELRTVKDSKYGNEDPKIVGGWDGMIGEILRQEADMAIAPLTVTLERESVVDFSKPFLSFNIKAYGNKNSRDNWSIFSFLRPLSNEVWVCIVLSMFAVGIVLYLVSRFSPYEWRVVSISETPNSDNPDVTDTKTQVINEFSFGNSLWFTLGSFMQQGSDISPRSVSGRLVGSVWWFFTLIVISSYTANLTTYLTVTRMGGTVSKYEQVANCPEDTVVEEPGWISYFLYHAAGIITGNVPCEMLVTNDGVKDFAVALPKGSKLREGINLALQGMKNDGLLQKLTRTWFYKTECDVVDAQRYEAELTLSQVAGLFYVLIGGLTLAMIVALIEFCQYGRQEAARANISLREALTAKTRLITYIERKPLAQRLQQREQERVPWNGGVFTGYYSPSNQVTQEETSLQATFTQV